jgi:uncharacterized membrane protein
MGHFAKKLRVFVPWWSVNPILHEKNRRAQNFIGGFIMASSIPPLPEQMQQKNNGLAIAAGWLGIGAILMFLVGFVMAFVYPHVQVVCQGIAVLACLSGLVLGIVALVQIKNNPGQKGKGMAIIGIVIGGLTICAAPVLVIATLMILGPVIGNVFSKINSSLAH